jgi:hypothetical protein
MRASAETTAAFSGVRSRQPEPFPFDPVIFVAQKVPKATDREPGNTGAHTFGSTRKFGRGLADAFETAFDGIIGLMIFEKRCTVHAGGVFFDPDDVFEDILKTLNRIAGRHVQPRDRPVTSLAASAFLPR